MRRKSVRMRCALALLMIAVLAIPLSMGNPVLAATMYENYDVSPSQLWGVSDWWAAQTFTPSADHTITSVWLRLSRVGSPGIITVSIRGTSGGLPFGPDLCSGAINGNMLTTSMPGDWYEIGVGGGYALFAGMTYATRPQHGSQPGAAMHARASSRRVKKHSRSRSNLPNCTYASHHRPHFGLLSGSPSRLRMRHFRYNRTYENSPGKTQ